MALQDLESDADHKHMGNPGGESGTRPEAPTCRRCGASASIITPEGPMCEADALQLMEELPAGSYPWSPIPGLWRDRPGSD